MDVKGDKKDFQPTYENLTEGQIKNRVREIIQVLKNDKIVGEHVKRHQIPAYYVIRHKLQVLYVVDLPNYWRLTYTFQTFKDGEKPQALILELMDHVQYNKRFGYFKKKSH